MTLAESGEGDGQQDTVIHLVSRDNLKGQSRDAHADRHGIEVGGFTRAVEVVSRCLTIKRPATPNSVVRAEGGPISVFV